MKVVACFVESVQNDELVVVCTDKGHRAKLKGLGAEHRFLGSKWHLAYGPRSQLPGILSILRDEGFAFAGAPSGWPPAEVFADLRNKGLTSGTFNEIIWSGPDQPSIRER